MKFTLGLGILTELEGNDRSGTGWPSSSLVRNIDVGWTPFGVGGSVNYYAAGALSSILDFDLEYLTSGVRNNDPNSPYFVWACCPWTCEENDWSTLD
jgi:hypothetical protein